MDVVQMQLLFMGMIFLLTTGVGLAPTALGATFSKRLISRASVRSRVLSCASCFGAGVFLFVCFLGLLPAADTKFHRFLEELGHTDERWEAFAEFPWGFFVVTCGFLTIFTIDKLVHAMEHSRSEVSSSATHILLTKSLTESDNQETNGLNDMAKNDHYHDHRNNEHEHSHGMPSSVIFLMALGIHSLFEGMAVGLQTQKDKVLEFSVAVLVHESVMAFTFGMEVSKSHVLSRWSKVLYVLIFTCTIPLGIATGVGLQSAPSSNREIVSAVLEAFATGIFIHVIFIEILAKEFPGHPNRPEKDIDQNSKTSSPPSEICLMLEKVSCICCGLLTLILINVFMHAHH